EPHPRTGKTDPMDGVSTYLALTFSTLLSSQGTEATFETVSPAAPGFPFGVSDSIRAFQLRFSVVRRSDSFHWRFRSASSRRLRQRTGP
ncbi:hypothetical protein, partial [Streptantibioticus silvisoli]